MTEAQAIAYIENYSWSKSRPGLARTRELLHKLGDPQDGLKFVHVAGSNGKGSTCAMLESVLRRAGYRVGLYTSPHLQNFRERIKIDGMDLSGSELARLADRVAPVADGMEDHPSQFELSTALALLAFREARCDMVVLEVGLGGELDSTNVIPAPEVAVITNIGLEHTEYLGSTIAEIARAKAGILKSGCRAVCYDGPREAVAVARQVCAEKRIPLTVADFSQIVPFFHSLSGQRFRYQGAEYALSLLGKHQLHNAAVVLETVDALRSRGWTIGADAVQAGLAQVHWPARLEVLCQEPLFLLDGGHNPQCTRALSEALEEYLPGKRVTFLIGVLADKEWKAMVEILRPHAARFLCVTPDSERSLPAEELAAYLRDALGLEARAFDRMETALDAALEDAPAVVFGSLYLAGRVRSDFPPALRRSLRKRGIHARNALGPETRGAMSERIADHIRKSELFRRAKTVLLYRAVKGEVNLDALADSPEAKGKRLLYPRCTGEREMVALSPESGDAWVQGRYGILEPDPARSIEVPPEEIDLVLCPCTAFDRQGGRLGMGAGYYDRYLSRCARACVAAVAFEAQRVANIPDESWDRKMETVFTENGNTAGPIPIS